jgi:hypothetical protein
MSLDAYCRVTIRVSGRIDLFAIEALEQLWETAPPPRQVLFDLSAVTELTPQGSKGLHAIHAREAGEEGAAIVIHPSFRKSRQLFPASWSVHLKERSARRKLERRFGQTHPPLDVRVHWELP